MISVNKIKCDGFPWEQELHFHYNGCHISTLCGPLSPWHDTSSGCRRTVQPLDMDGKW